MINRRSLHDDVVEEIGRSIVGGVFEEGASLPIEADLASDLGVSRNVLREAIKVLVSKGMLDVRPKTGTTVRPKEQWHMLDPEVLSWEAADDLRLPYAFDFCEFRLIVEPKASFLAAKRATAAEIRAILDACDAAGSLRRPSRPDAGCRYRISPKHSSRLAQCTAAASRRAHLGDHAGASPIYRKHALRISSAVCRCTAQLPRRYRRAIRYWPSRPRAHSAKCLISISPAAFNGEKADCHLSRMRPCRVRGGGHGHDRIRRCRA